VQSIIRELRGEKIDIVEWSEDPVQFVMNALSPARVQHVSIVDDENRIMEVVVEDQQLSLAIGKKGQNVRLAAKLTGWRIDIKSEEEKRKEVEAQLGALETGGDAVPDTETETPVDTTEVDNPAAPPDAADENA
jgi:N utilization substance protein A